MPRTVLLAALLAAAPAARADDAKKPPAWTLDTDQMTFPDRPAGGTLLGQPFAVKSAKLFAAAQLTLSSGEGKGAADSYLWIVLGGLKKQSVVGETLAFGPELPYGTAVHIVRGEGAGGKREVQFAKAVAVKLQFGRPKNGNLPGKVYLCGGDKKTVVAGTFEVDDPDAKWGAPPPAPNKPAGKPVAPATDAPEYLTDPAKMLAPDTPVAGNVMGGAFKLDKAELSGGVLTVRQGAGAFPDAAAMLFLFLGGESPAGKTFLAGGSAKQGAKTPHVHLKRTFPGDDLPTTEAMLNGFGLRLEFGPARNGKIPGKLYLCCPDKGKGDTSIAGRFEIDWPAK